MIPPFKYYFYPFLHSLSIKGCSRLADLSSYIAEELKLSADDMKERTKGGSITKHTSRINYCASYLKKMGLVSVSSPGAYSISNKGLEVLEKFGERLTLTDLRNLP